MKNEEDTVTKLELIREQHKLWETSNFGNQPMRRAAMGCVEECGELAHCMLKFEQGIRGMDLEKFISEGRDALADIGIYAISAASKIKGYSFIGNLKSYMLDTLPRHETRDESYAAYLERIPYIALTFVRVVKFSNKLLYAAALEKDPTIPDAAPEAQAVLVANLFNELNIMANYLYGVGIYELVKGTWDAQVHKREWKEANKLA